MVNIIIRKDQVIEEGETETNIIVEFTSLTKSAEAIVEEASLVEMAHLHIPLNANSKNE